MEATSVAFYATIYLAIPTQSFAFRPSPSPSPHVPVAPPVHSRSVVTAAPACPNICELTDLLIGTPELSPSTNTSRVSAHMDKNSEDVTLRRPARPPVHRALTCWNLGQCRRSSQVSSAQGHTQPSSHSPFKSPRIFRFTFIHTTMQCLIHATPCPRLATCSAI